MPHKQPFFPENVFVGGPYSPAIAVGDQVFIAGQGPISPSTRQIAGDTFEAQLELTFSNLESVLASAGCTLDDCVKVKFIYRRWQTSMRSTKSTSRNSLRPSRFARPCRQNYGAKFRSRSMRLRSAAAGRESEHAATVCPAFIQVAIRFDPRSYRATLLAEF